MNIKEYYKEILNSEINEKLIGVDEGYARSNRINDSMRRKVERGIAVPAGLRSAGKIAVNKARRADKKRGLLDFEDEMNEATPAEIQAHQIARLDRIGNKFNGGEYGADLRKPRNLRAGRRIANLYKKAGVLGGFRPYSGLAGEDPVMIRTDTWPAYPEAVTNANAELKRDRGSNRTVGQRIRGFVKRTTGLEEMALTKKAFNTMLKGVKKARDMGDATSGNKSALHWRNYEKQSDALVNALRSPKLYDMGPKGGLVQIGRLKGSRDATGIITAAANLRTKVPKTVLRSAKELAKLHGMFYVTHGLGDEDVTNPIGKTTAVGGKLGPTSGFIRQSRRVSDGFDQQSYN